MAKYIKTSNDIIHIKGTNRVNILEKCMYLYLYIYYKIQSYDYW